MKARLWIGALVAIAVIAVAATYALQKRKTPQTAAKPVVEEPVDVELSLEAVLQTATSIPVGIPIEGKIESFQVDAGDEVYEGQLLAQIRSPALETAKLEAETDLERAETRVRNLEAAMSAARLEASRAVADAARVKNDYERASKNFQREKMLLAEGATPRRNFERAQKEHIALEAETRNHDAVAAGAEERITSTQNELDAAKKLLEGKSEDVEQAAQRVGAGNVLSPVNGIVVGRRGQAGDDVHPSMTDLFQIATDMSAMQAVAQASPEQIRQLKPGQPATVTIVEMGGEILQGSVLKIDGDRVFIEFANPNPLIKPGLTAQVRIKLT